MWGDWGRGRWTGDGWSMSANVLREPPGLMRSSIQPRRTSEPQRGHENGMAVSPSLSPLAPKRRSKMMPRPTPSIATTVLHRVP